MNIPSLLRSIRFRSILYTLCLCTGALQVPAQVPGGDYFIFDASINSDYYLCIDYHIERDECAFLETSVDVNVTENHPVPDAGTFYISENTNVWDGYVCDTVGPGFNQTVYGWANHFAIGGCVEIGEVSEFTAETDFLHRPDSVQATDNTHDSQVIITWAKGTDFPDTLHRYVIYRGTTVLDTVDGTERQYIDQGLSPGETFEYTVRTYTASFGGHLSDAASDPGSTFGVGLVASDGLHFGKTKLSWNDLSDAASDIRVGRAAPGMPTVEELVILNKNATTYTDVEGIPGFPYTYYVTPLHDSLTFQSDTDQGYSRPDGKITGHVYSPEGAGVDSVDIYVELLSAIPPGGAPLPAMCATTYCATTDISGYYEIEDIYYYEEAEFRIYPQRGTHEFDPDTLVRKLNANSRIHSFVDFTDLNVITVGGTVSYADGAQCGVPGVGILINGNDVGIMTDENGEWLTSVTNEGLYTFTPKAQDHEFMDPSNNDETTLFINAGNTDIDFTDITQRTIHIIAQNGCQEPLGDTVTVRVTASGGCFERFYAVLAADNGLLDITDLPPRDLTVEVTSIFPVNTNILEQLGEFNIDLTELDSMEIITEKDSLDITSERTDVLPDGTQVITPADTTVVHFLDTMYSTEQTLRFIYHSDIDVAIDFEDAGADIYDCLGGDLVVMDQGREYLLEINVVELLGGCLVDTGTLIIYDEISDREGASQKIPISNGIARYTVIPGEPDIAASASHSHEKFLFIIPQVDFADPDPVTFWAFVTGIKSNTPTFVTRTPEIPQLIIHDPPGDNSFATIEAGTSFTTTTATSVQTGGEGGFFANFKGGAKTEILEVIELQGGVEVEFEIKAGTDENHNSEITTTLTFLDTYSTSPSQVYVGHEGDVYIGAATNQTFSISEELKIDPASCVVTVDSVVELGVAGFATTFIYTEYHLMNTLIPSFQALLRLQETNTEAGKMEYNRILADIESWKSILAKNAANRDTNAAFIKNISISSGADYSSSESRENGVHNTHTFNHFFETSLKVGGYAEVETPFQYFELDAGVMGTFRHEWAEVFDSTSQSGRTVGYTISDNDIGDFFSIDVLRDTAYDVPAFRLVSGTSSCPHEPNTQPREVPKIGVFPPIVNNVPPDGTANFVLSLTNLSESGETRQYAVQVVPNSNPDGAIVRVAGSLINSGPVAYYFDANQTLDLAMTITRGPLASNYDSIGVTIYSECEFDIWGEGGELTQADTAWFSVNFLSQCSNISLHLPNNGWLVNQASNNILHTAFTGYDINNPFLQSITLQMKRDGFGYINQVTIDKQDLTGPFYDYLLDVSAFPDGSYTLRARANCGVNGGHTYSSEVSGIIDRTSLAPFGTPTPADGFLREGQEVSVSFDKLINCNFNSYPTEFSLVREDTGEDIPFTTSCFQNKVIINTNPPLLDRPDLEGVKVTARAHFLQDLNGNVQEYPTQWSFLVNVKPVFWDPEILLASGFEGQTHTIQGVLKNTSLVSKAFSLDAADDVIVDFPEWLTPLQSRGTILPSNDYTVDFAVDPELTPGIYTGIVTAMVDSLPVSMEVTFELLANPVYWPFDPSQYQYTMTVVAQFSLDDTDDNLSADTRDIVGAFVNGQVRGITNIEYLPDLDVYRAFLTIYSNNQGGGGAETVRFRFWHALNGVEYGAVETIVFTLDDTEGTVADPLMLHPEGFFQIIPLKQGWNWISLNVQTSDMSREHIFQNILNSPSGNSITIKSKTQTAQYNPGSGWNGNLSLLELGLGYLLHLSNAPDTLRVVGFPSESVINVNVSGNWNWIGFPRLEPEPVNDVLATLTPGPGDILKSQHKFSSFDTGLNSWVGNLNDFSPGLGYKLFLSSSGVITYQPSRSPDYNLDPYLYEYNMNVTGHVDLEQIGEYVEEDLIVVALINGECRGIGTLEYIHQFGEYRTIMLVHGNIADLGKPVEFRVQNTLSSYEHLANGDQQYFIADALVGSVAEPYLFFTRLTGSEDIAGEGYDLEQSLPNPTHGRTEIGFTLPQRDLVLLRVFDTDGRLVQIVADGIFDSGHHRIEADLVFLPKGMYYYELKSGSFTGVKKLVLQ